MQVNELLFSADFYVLDMEDEGSPMPTPLLLGRPFMKTTRTNIDVHQGTVTMKLDGEISSFNILEEKGDPSIFGFAMLLISLILCCSRILRDLIKKMT